MEILQKRGNFKPKFLAARQFISPTQAPWLSAASEGLRNRHKYNTSSIYTVNSNRTIRASRPKTVRIPLLFSLLSASDSIRWRCQITWSMIRIAQLETSKAGTRFGKNLAPYRIGKRPHNQNRAKIHQKIPKIVFFEYFWCIFGLFWGLLCFPIL